MKLSRILCYFGSHDLTQWRTVKTRYGPPGTVAGLCYPGMTDPRSVPPPSPANERHCKRLGCKYNEVKRVRAKGAAQARQSGGHNPRG